MHTAARINRLIDRFVIDSFTYERWPELEKAMGQPEFYQKFISGLSKGFRIQQAQGGLSERLVALAARGGAGLPNHACLVLLKRLS